MSKVENLEISDFWHPNQREKVFDIEFLEPPYSLTYHPTTAQPPIPPAHQNPSLASSGCYSPPSFFYCTHFSSYQSVSGTTITSDPDNRTNIINFTHPEDCLPGVPFEVHTFPHIWTPTLTACQEDSSTDYSASSESTAYWRSFEPTPTHIKSESCLPDC